MKRLIFATGNENKMKEIREIMEGLPVEILSMKEAGIEADIVEDGLSFEENALIKARAVCRLAGEMVLADDSGLEVDVLDGRPGVWSSSFGGEEGNHARNNLRMMEELRRAGVKPGDRPSARFRCVMVLAGNGRVLAEFSGSVEGYMLTEPAGEGGFGYDPLFVPEGYDRSFAQLPMEVKNSMSHRARALAQVVEWMKKRRA